MQKRVPCEERERERAARRICAWREKPRGRRRRRTSTAAAISARLEHGRRRQRAGKEDTVSKSTPGHGLNAPSVGSPDVLKVAPDAFGDHRTHAQRDMQNCIAPDDGHRTLALASGALEQPGEHQTHLTGSCRDTVPASGECSLALTTHRTHRDSVRCSVRCSSEHFFN